MSSLKADIKSMTSKELGVFMETLGEKRFRGGQVFAWLSKGVTDFEQMTNLPAALREKLDEEAYIENLFPARVQMSELDGTRKYLYELNDGNAVETVFMEYKFGTSVCVSSQAGCRMGCTFCASGLNGLARDLTAGEMLDQIIKTSQDVGERISHVVVMGTGEPFDNYDNLCTFIENLHDKQGLNIGLRNITVSTCGIIPRMKDFARDFPQVNLAISLHAPNYKLRNNLMPVNRKYPIEQVIEAAKKHAERTGRQVTFEYALIRGVNDTEAHAAELAALMKGWTCHVNLIPLNYVKERKMRGSERAAAEAFKNVLDAHHVSATIRREMGSDISAACGQLRLGYINSEQ